MGVTFHISFESYSFYNKEIKVQCYLNCLHSKMTVTELKHSKDFNSSDYDAIVVVGAKIDDIPEETIKEPLKAYVNIDPSGEKGVFVVPTNLVPKKIVFSGTGALDNDYDDVRSYANAACAGIKKAIETGSKAPLLYAKEKKFDKAGLVSILGALKALYVPLEVREQVPEKASKANYVGVFGLEQSELDLALALEAGRIVSRDVGGSDPERMAAARVEEYIRQTFENTNVKIEVVKGQQYLKKSIL